MQTDDQLLTAFKNKDTKALEILFKWYYSTIVVQVTRIINNTFIAEDIAIVSLERCWKTEKDFESIQHLKAWLFFTANNLAIDHLRARQRHTNNFEEIRFLAEQEQKAQESGISGYLKEEFIQFALQELENLKAAKQKNVLTLFFLEELSINEIAERMGIKPSTVYTQREKGLQALRAKFNERFPKDPQ